MNDTTKRTQRATEYIETPRLIDLMPGWISWLKVKNHRPRGILTYQKEVTYIVTALGGDTATTADLTWEKLSLHLAELVERGVGPSTINKRIAAARSFCAWLVKAKHLDHNPALELDRTRRSRPLPRALNTAELRGVVELLATPIETIEPWRRAKWQRDMRILGLGLLAGMRLSEIASLTWKYVDLEAQLIQVVHGKGDKDRIIPLHARLVTMLETVPPEQRKRDTAVAGAANGRCLSYKSLCHTFDRFVRLALPDVSCHRLRHSFATEALKAGADLKVISELMGHADISTTSMYILVDETQKRAAIDLLPDFGAPEKASPTVDALRAQFAPRTAPARPIVPGICLQCDTPLDTPARGPAPIYCSIRCGVRYRREHPAA